MFVDLVRIARQSLLWIAPRAKEPGLPLHFLCPLSVAVNRQREFRTGFLRLLFAAFGFRCHTTAPLSVVTVLQKSVSRSLTGVVKLLPVFSGMETQCF